MGRPKNQIDTVTLKIATTPGVQRLLERLVASGLYGKNPAEAAERLIAERLRVLVGEDALLRRSPSKSTGRRG